MHIQGEIATLHITVGCKVAWGGCLGVDKGAKKAHSQGMEATNHQQHLENHEWVESCSECHSDATAIDWLMAVRTYGLETANKMFP
jgi:hypothetical protein